jgi:hypothetical protein
LAILRGGDDCHFLCLDRPDSRDEISNGLMIRVCYV